MALSTPDAAPSTPPPGGIRTRARKPSEKVLQVQQSLRTNTEVPQPRPARTRTTATQQARAEASASTQQPSHDAHPPTSDDEDTIRVANGRRNTKIEDVAQLVASLKDII